MSLLVGACFGGLARSFASVEGQTVVCLYALYGVSANTDLFQLVFGQCVGEFAGDKMSVEGSRLSPTLLQLDPVNRLVLLVEHTR